jgi:hypothetical protein
MNKNVKKIKEEIRQEYRKFYENSINAKKVITMPPNTRMLGHRNLNKEVLNEIEFINYETILKKYIK